MIGKFDLAAFFAAGNFNLRLEAVAKFVFHFAVKGIFRSGNFFLGFHADLVQRFGGFLGLTHRKPFLQNPFKELLATGFRLYRQQSPTVPGADLPFFNGLFHFLIQGQQAQRVRDVTAAFPQHLTETFLSVTVNFRHFTVSRGFFHGVEILTLDIFNQPHFGGFFVIRR